MVLLKQSYSQVFTFLKMSFLFLKKPERFNVPNPLSICTMNRLDPTDFNISEIEIFASAYLFSMLAEAYVCKVAGLDPYNSGAPLLHPAAPALLLLNPPCPASAIACRRLLSMLENSRCALKQLLHGRHFVRYGLPCSLARTSPPHSENRPVTFKLRHFSARCDSA